MQGLTNHWFHVSTGNDMSQKDSLLSLLVAVGETSTMVLLGFLLKKGGLASSQTKSELGGFATTIALPAQVVKVLATIAAEDVALGFFGGVVTAKLLVAALAFVCTYVLDRSTQSLGRSAVFAMFSTQSNDYALGLPIASAVFGKTQPTFPLQLYLLAPVQLAVITSACLMALESQYERERARSHSTHDGHCRRHLDAPTTTADDAGQSMAEVSGNAALEALSSSYEAVADCTDNGSDGVEAGPSSPFEAADDELDDPKDTGGQLPRENSTASRRSSGGVAVYSTAIMQLLMNPIVLASLVAVVIRLVFWNGVPDAVLKLLVTLGNAYPATVLLSLGMSIADLERNVLQGVKAVQAFLLVATKLLVVSVIASSMAWLISNNESESEYAFLYGTFPTAPAVPVFAQQYGVDEEVIALATVVCLAISVPLIATTGLVLLLRSSTGAAYVSAISLVCITVGCVSLVADAVSVALGVARRNMLHARSQFAAHRLPLSLAIYQALHVLSGFLYTHVTPNSLEDADGATHRGERVTGLVRNCFLLHLGLELQFLLWSCLIVGLCIFYGLEHCQRCTGLLAHIGTLALSATLTCLVAVVSQSTESEPLWPFYPLGLPEIVVSSCTRGLCSIFVVVCLLEKRSVALSRKHTIPDSMQSLMHASDDVYNIQHDMNEDHRYALCEEEREAMHEADRSSSPVASNLHLPAIDASGEGILRSEHWQSASQAVLNSEGFLRHGDWERIEYAQGAQPGKVVRRLMEMELWLCVYALYSIFNAVTAILSETLYLLGSAHTTYHLAVELLHHFMLNLHGIVVLFLLGRGASAGFRVRKRIAHISMLLSRRIGSRARRVVRAASQPDLL